MEVVKDIGLLEGTGEISEAQCAEFRANGHALTRNLFNSAEMEGIRQSVSEAMGKYSVEKHLPAGKHLRGKAFSQLEAGNLWKLSGGVRQFVLSPRLATIAAGLLGVSNVRLYHDQALFKLSREAATHWRQDQYFWPLDTTDTVTLWLPLTDLSIDMGMISYASGSHREGIFGEKKGSDESDLRYRKYIRERQWPISRAAGMRAGDACWHYGSTIHYTLANDSNKTREVMTVIYMAEGARITDPKNKWQVSDRENWLMGLPPGRLAASALNPLLL